SGSGSGSGKAGALAGRPLSRATMSSARCRAFSGSAAETWSRVGSGSAAMSRSTGSGISLSVSWVMVDVVLDQGVPVGGRSVGLRARGRLRPGEGGLLPGGGGTGLRGAVLFVSQVLQAGEVAELDDADRTGQGAGGAGVGRGVEDTADRGVHGGGAGVDALVVEGTVGEARDGAGGVGEIGAEGVPGDGDALAVAVHLDGDVTLIEAGGRAVAADRLRPRLVGVVAVIRGPGPDQGGQL